MPPLWRRGVVLVGSLAVLAAATLFGSAAGARAPHVLRVGTYDGIPGEFSSIQAAVLAARPGDWILVAPGDYKEQGYAGEVEPAGVLITTPYLHLRGMDRNSVIVDGTKPGTPACSPNPADQGALARNGVEVWKANYTWVENLTVCNYLTGPTGGQGEEIWWNGGDGKGQIGLSEFWGNYLTATSTYASSQTGTLGKCCGVDYPAGDYGIFSSNSTNGWFNHDFASNMADAAYYIGACQQVCNQVLADSRGETSSLCLSSTNAGGYLLVERNTCFNNKTGLVSNSQNNDDQPSPQNGLCPAGVTGPLGTQSCTVWLDNIIDSNNNPNVPGNGSGLSGAGPVGTGMILAGSRYVTMAGNRVTNNGAWGELVADLPDQESAPPWVRQQCQGGTFWEPNTQTCYFQAWGNVSENNVFSGNGFYGNPTNGDIGLAALPNNPGNCFAGDSTPDTATAPTGTDPPGMEVNPLYAPTNGMCTTPNGGDETVLVAEALCATQLVVPCALPAGTPASYPRPDPNGFTLYMPAAQPTMPNPCAGVPKNPWCR